MAHDGIGRRLLAALAGSTPAFTPTELTTDAQGAGHHRLLAALAGSTPAFRSAGDSDEYTSQPTRSVHTDVEDTDPKPRATDFAGLRRAMHRTILAVDVEAFGDRRRTTAHPAAVRAGLYRVLRQAFEQAGVSWDASDNEDRGDGVLVLVPAEIPKAPFVDALPRALVAALREHNTTQSVEARIRLRMALHAGEVTYDQGGVTGGAAVNGAFRLLDAPPLKDALANSPEVLAVIASGMFYDEVIRHSPIGDAGTYRPVNVTAKEASQVAWISLPEAGGTSLTASGVAVTGLLQTAVQELASPEPNAPAILGELAWQGEVAAVAARALPVTEERKDAAQEAEFSAFYRQHARPLMGFLILHGASTVEAADVAQDTMASAYRRWSSIDHPRAWIYRMASRAWIRQALSTREALSAEPWHHSPPTMHPTDIEQWELRSDIAAALAKLPARQRQVIAWTLAGYTPSEVAAELSMSRERVHANLSRARRTLRTLLAESEETSDATASRDPE